MSKLRSNTLILSAARLTNYTMMLIGPIFLVRLLSVETYGQYREFVLYAMLISGFLTFSINGNLLYFIPKYPAEEAKYVSQSILFMAFSSAAGILIVYLARDIILARTSFNFLGFLLAYLAVYLNFDILEFYWLGKRQANLVLYYSCSRVLIRVGIIIVMAYWTGRIDFIIMGMIGVELARCIFVVFLLSKKRLFTKRFDLKSMKEQLSYFSPMGLSRMIGSLDMNISQLFISVKLGAASLALYSIGAYQVPVMAIFRSSLTDALFPEIIRKNNASGMAEGLTLWKKANVALVMLIFPIFMILFMNSRILITFLFTEKYLASVPIFQVYLFLMLRQCFDMGTPLRSINKTSCFIWVTMLGLTTNILMLFPFYRVFGLVGPALAVIISDIIGNLFAAERIIKYYEINYKELLYWKRLGKIISIVIICAPVMLASDLLPLDGVSKAAIGSLAYALCYILFIVYSGADEGINIIPKPIKARIDLLFSYCLSITR